MCLVFSGWSVTLCLIKNPYDHALALKFGSYSNVTIASCHATEVHMWGQMVHGMAKHLLSKIVVHNYFIHMQLACLGTIIRRRVTHILIPEMSLSRGTMSQGTSWRTIGSRCSRMQLPGTFMQCCSSMQSSPPWQMRVSGGPWRQIWRTAGCTV